MKMSLVSSTALAALVVLASSLTGCGGNGSTLGGGGGNATINFLDIPLSAAQINALQPGTTIYAMVERENGIVFKPVKLGNRYTAGSDDFLTFVDGQRQFGFGDSGSPMLTADGKTIGALSGSFGGDNVLITPIDQMINTVNRSASSGNSHQDQLVWITVGMSAEAKTKLREAGYRIPDVSPSRLPITPTGRGGDPRDIVAGRSLAAMYIDGPLVSVFAVGTATHAPTKNELLAFGHRNDWQGQMAFPLAVRPARVVQFINDPTFGSFKLAVPDGNVAGGITADRRSGILIDRNAAVSRLELVVRANGKETSHWISRTDSDPFGDMYRLFYLGAGEIMAQMYDTRNLGMFTASVDVTTSGVTTKTQLNTYNWTTFMWDGSPASDAWQIFHPMVNDTTKVVLTISPL